MLASAAGGMYIEEVARETPELLITEPIDIMAGIQTEQAEKVARGLGFDGDKVDQAIDIITKLYEIFLRYDCTMIEINPMAEDASGKGMVGSYWHIVMQL